LRRRGRKGSMYYSVNLLYGHVFENTVMFMALGSPLKAGLLYEV